MTTQIIDANSPEGAALLSGGEIDPPTAEPAKPPATPPTVQGARNQQLSETSLKERLERERKSAETAFFKEHYGTTDPAEIAKIKAERENTSKEYERLKRAEESRQKARLTEQQRLEQDLKKRDERIAALETQLKEQKRTIVADKQDAVISGLVNGKVRPERMKFFRSDLAAHIRGLTPEKQKQFNAKTLEKFVSNYLEEYPEFAVPAKPPKTEPAADKKPPAPAPRVVRPLTSGAKTPAPRAAVGAAPQTPSKDGPTGGKTVKPGPNQMTKAELRAHYQKLGKQMPY